jgi:hypothetical protein
MEEQLAAAAFPHDTTGVRLKETHLSWILLTGTYAYKVKKPVRFDFVDASTLERRRFLCQEELRLNRRFAPELYLDVVPITEDGGRLRFGGAGAAVEYAVRMHQFDEADELAVRLDRGAVSASDVQAFGARLADAHARAEVAAPGSGFGTIAAVRQPMLDNFPLLRRHLADDRHQRLIGRLEAWTRHALSRHEALVESRRQSGMVRECHGDLHARNIVCWRQQWMAFDCLEFDPALRWIDVVSDVSFLFMDLASRQRGDLACQFLNRYLEATGDYEGLRLLPLYCAYLALVRAKVDALGAETADAGARRNLQARLERRLDAAAGFVDAPTPSLLLMHGVTASGKSWLSERLAGALPAIRIRSDLERKRLAGVAALAHRRFAFGEGDYSDAATQATYGRLLDCTDAALDGGRNVIVDASFLDRRHRDAFRSLAGRRDCPALIVSCAADPDTLQRRLQARTAGGRDPSEATREVLERQLRDAVPLAPDELPHAVEADLRDGSGIEGLAARIRRQLDAG